MDELKNRILELEKQLENEKKINKSVNYRQKIDEMSSEVVDSNPYRYLIKLKLN
jgi:ubiquitin-like modifier-activating enzyme 5